MSFRILLIALLGPHMRRCWSLPLLPVCPVSAGAGCVARVAVGWTEVGWVWGCLQRSVWGACLLANACCWQSNYAISAASCIQSGLCCSHRLFDFEEVIWMV